MDLFLQVRDIKQSHLASQSTDIWCQTNSTHLSFHPGSLSCYTRWPVTCPSGWTGGEKTPRHYLGISCFSHSQISISGFLLSHLQWWPELYNAVNWEELHNMSRLESMRRNLSDLQHTYNSNDPQKMTTRASCCLFIQRWGNISEAENYWEFTLSSWTLTAVVTSVSYVRSFFVRLKNKKI